MSAVSELASRTWILLSISRPPASKPSSGLYEIHSEFRLAGAAPGHLREVQERQQPRLQAEPDHRQQWRKAVLLQRGHCRVRSRRRGDHPGAVLAELSGDGPPCGSRAGHRPDHRAEHLEDYRRTIRERHDAQDEDDHHQFAGQPDRVGLQQGGAARDFRGGRRRGNLHSVGRNLRTTHLRWRRARQHRFADAGGPRFDDHGQRLQQGLRDDGLAPRLPWGSGGDRQGD